MSLALTSQELQTAWQHLRHQWQEAAGAWNDSVRVQFQQQYWQALENQTPRTIQEMEHLAQVIAQARQNVK